MSLMRLFLGHGTLKSTLTFHKLISPPHVIPETFLTLPIIISHCFTDDMMTGGTFPRRNYRAHWDVEFGVFLKHIWTIIGMGLPSNCYTFAACF